MLKNLEPMKKHNPIISRTPIRQNSQSFGPDIRTLKPKPSTMSVRVSKASGILPDRGSGPGKGPRPAEEASPKISSQDTRKQSVFSSDMNSVWSGTVEKYSPILSQKDKVHHKFKSEYNAFMNKLSLSDTPIVKSDTESMISDRTEITDSVREIENHSFLTPKTQENSIQTLNSPAGGLRAYAPAGGLRTSFHTPPPLTLFPKEASDDLEQTSEILPLSKKEIEVWDDGILVSYKTFRQGIRASDNIIFVLPPLDTDAKRLCLDQGSLGQESRPEALDFGNEVSKTESKGVDSETKFQGESPTDGLNSFLFIGYSKKQLYDEYMLVGHDAFFILDIIEEESYCIPMHQIVRILEYGHVMYLLEKTDLGAVQDDTYICYAKPVKAKI